MSAKQNSPGITMCECSKGYVCPRHTVTANKAGVAKRRKPSGMTIRQALCIMQANRSASRVFARNKETQKAARILMGAYFSSGERGCPSLQQIVDRFSVTVATPPKISIGGTYEINKNLVGYYAMYKTNGITRYLDKYGHERTSCNGNVVDGTCGYFVTLAEAENAVRSHKNKPFKIGDTVQAIANPGNGLSNTGYFTVGEKFVVEEVAHRQNTVRIVGKNGYWDKSRFELVEPAIAQDDKWAKLAKELHMRSFTIERRTITNSANELLRNVSATEISEKLKDSGFKDVRPEHIYLIPISAIGYYKVPIKFNESSKVEISLWIVPL